MTLLSKGPRVASSVFRRDALKHLLYAKENLDMEHKLYSRVSLAIKGCNEGKIGYSQLISVLQDIGVEVQLLIK